MKSDTCVLSDYKEDEYGQYYLQLSQNFSNAMINIKYLNEAHSSLLDTANKAIYQ
jgi:hypothetical protein